MRPSTEVEYRIVVTNTGSYFAQDVLIRDVLPSGLVYKPNSTYIDNVLTNDGITSGGIYIDDLNVGQSKQCLPCYFKRKFIFHSKLNNFS